jgi:hypothetical protein
LRSSRRLRPGSRPGKLPVPRDGSGQRRVTECFNPIGAISADRGADPFSDFPTSNPTFIAACRLLHPRPWLSGAHRSASSP